MDKTISKGKNILYTSVAIFVGVYFLFIGLTAAKEFLVPIVTAIILALLLIPLSNKFESWGTSRSISSLISTFLIFLLSLGVMLLVSYQVKIFVDDWDEIKETMGPKLESFENYVIENTGFTQSTIDNYKDQEDIKENIDLQSSGKRAFAIAGVTMSFLADFLLTFIYLFFLLNYRNMFKTFILKLFSTERQEEVKRTINDTAKVAQGYLRGKLLLTIFLAIFYGIGLGLSGVNNFIIISLIAAFLNLIPFVGNMIGLFLAFTIGYLTQGETSILIGIVITFSVVQFVESYILEPYVVGDHVDLHPFFIIAAIILGNMVWGIMGMVLAIPVLGIINVVFQCVPPLHPYGYLLSSKTGKSNK